MAWWKDRSVGAGEKRGLVTALGESADRRSGCSVSGPHEWPPPEEGIWRDEPRELRRASTQASYDEKKRKKSRTAFSDFFRRMLPVVLTHRLQSRKTCRENWPRFERCPTQYYRKPTAGFQIPAGRIQIKGSLSALVSAAHCDGRNNLFSVYSCDALPGRDRSIRQGHGAPRAITVRGHEWRSAGDVRSRWTSFAASS